MSKTVSSKSLKYSIRERYIALCARTGKQPDFADLYQVVASAAGVSARRAQRILLANREDLTTATINELGAFAMALGCSADELAAEAAGRVVAP